MAAPIQWILGGATEKRAPHHESIEALWNLKWKHPCKLGIYPFHDGNYEDFAQVFDDLIKANINDAYSDAYTEAFFPVCDKLLKEATGATAAGLHAKASLLYFRVACLYRISRFPIMNSPLKWRAFEAQKAAYMLATTAWVDPIHEVYIQHAYAKISDKSLIPVYVRLPAKVSIANPVPTILLITGLDEYRPDNTQRTHEFLRRGWAVIIVEIPGTADCPADPEDATSPDRLWDSVFSWIRKQAVFNTRKICVWGLSTGGYYAARIAHTHHDQILGSVAHGAGIHHFFSSEWLDHVDKHEYPFNVSRALAMKFGYNSVEDFKAQAQKKFSLLDSGIVHKQCSRLLMVNGTLDGLMPCEDSLLLMEYGNPKEARLFSGLQHMAYPSANTVVYSWLEDLIKGCC